MESDYGTAALSHDLFEIDSGSRKYYGGSQNLYKTERERKCGCGITGAVDVLLYLEALKSREFSFSSERFLNLSDELRKKYIPIIPGRGVNAFILASGLNRYFKAHGMKYHAHWKCTLFNKWKKTADMLKADIPVIIAIGNNFPLVWGKKSLNLYVKDSENQSGEEIFRKEQSVYGHFVVITAVKENCLTVSSWGRKYYINVDEYNRYVTKHSTNIYSNILVIEKK